MLFVFFICRIECLFLTRDSQPLIKYYLNFFFSLKSLSSFMDPKSSGYSLILRLLSYSYKLSILFSMYNSNLFVFCKNCPLYRKMFCRCWNWDFIYRMSWCLLCTSAGFTNFIYTLLAFTVCLITSLAWATSWSLSKPKSCLIVFWLSC